MQKQTFSEYVTNKDFKASLPYFSKQKAYKLNGVFISEETLNNMYPTDLPIVSANSRKFKGDNPDKTKVA